MMITPVYIMMSNAMAIDVTKPTGAQRVYLLLEAVTPFAPAVTALAFSSVPCGPEPVFVW